MEEDFFEFEPASEAAPELVLGKKKKKKKKKKDVDATTVTDDPNIKSTKQEKEVNESNEAKEDDNELNDTHAVPTSTFGALALNENDSEPEPISSDEKVGITITAEDQDEDSNLTANTKKKKKKKKKGGKIQDEDDLDPFEEALKEAHQLNTEEASKVEDEEVFPEAQNEEPEERRTMTAAEKKKAKKEREKQAKKEKAMKEQAELDNLLAELGESEPNPETANAEEKEEAPLESAPMTAAQKKRAKKKKKNAQKNDEELLNVEPDETAGPSNFGDDTQNESSAPATVGDVDDLLAELTGAADSSASKKKTKKKKKKTGKAEDDSTEKTAGSSEPTEPKKTKKKESAAIRKMREEREKRLAEEERLRKLKEEEDARIAEEERKREEEERKQKEEKERKKAAEKAKRDRKRQEGTLLSKAEKEKRRKAELFRKQMMDMGMVPAVNTDSNSTNQKERVIYGRRRKPQKQKSEEQGGASNASASTDEPTTTEGSVKKSQVEEKGPEIIPDAWDDQKESAELKKGETSETKDDRETKKNAVEDKVEDEDETDSESETDSDDSEYEGMSKTEIAAEKRLEALRKQRTKQKEQAYAARSPDHLRSPVICILGHVDTGKTKILDRIRRTNVQDGEAGGITQQIGATYFPIDAVKKEATKLKEGKELKYNVPSLLIIDTPGHESFTNLRSRGSSLCDIAILVVDIMHGLEPQTRESIDLLKLRKTPFIVALNKIDRIYDWKAQPHNCPTRDSLAKQPRHAQEEFARRVKETQLEFAEIGFNTELYWENSDVRKTVSFVPTSAISGEGIPDLLMLLLALPQKLLQDRLMFNSILEATVLEVKVIEGLGTTIDIILTGGTIREGDTIMVVGLDGPLVTTVRALLTPHPMKEMRVKGQYLHHKEIVAAQGIKISADGLDKAVAGTQLMVVQNPEDEDEMEFVRQEVMKDFQTILTNVDKSGLGVYVQASTLGSLEALLEFLRTSDIPVSGINIGPVHKRDVTKASTMLERRKEFATILAFDVSVEKEARELAEDAGVKIFTADIIYHLFDQFTAYMEDIKRQRKEEASEAVVFPSICKILPQHIYNKRDPIVLGVDVMDGILRVGTPLVVRHGTGWLDIGRVASLELNKKQVMTVRKGESVAVKIQHKNTEHIMYGRHFTFEDTLYSKMSRSSIELLKKNFRDDLERTDWALVVKLKRLFNIQ